MVGLAWLKDDSQLAEKLAFIVFVEKYIYQPKIQTV